MPGSLLSHDGSLTQLGGSLVSDVQGTDCCCEGDCWYRVPLCTCEVDPEPQPVYLDCIIMEEFFAANPQLGGHLVFERTLPNETQLCYDMRLDPALRVTVLPPGALDLGAIPSQSTWIETNLCGDPSCCEAWYRITTCGCEDKPPLPFPYFIRVDPVDNHPFGQWNGGPFPTLVWRELINGECMCLRVNQGSERVNVLPPGAVVLENSSFSQNPTGCNCGANQPGPGAPCPCSNDRITSTQWIFCADCPTCCVLHGWYEIQTCGCEDDPLPFPYFILANLVDDHPDSPDDLVWREYIDVGVQDFQCFCFRVSVTSPSVSVLPPGAVVLSNPAFMNPVSCDCSLNAQDPDKGAPCPCSNDRVTAVNWKFCLNCGYCCCPGCADLPSFFWSTKFCPGCAGPPPSPFLKYTLHGTTLSRRDGGQDFFCDLDGFSLTIPENGSPGTPYLCHYGGAFPGGGGPAALIPCPGGAFRITAANHQAVGLPGAQNPETHWRALIRFGWLSGGFGVTAHYVIPITQSCPQPGIYPFHSVFDCSDDAENPDGFALCPGEVEVELVGADVGACCLPSGACQQTTQAACTSMGGTFSAGVPCSPNPCPSPPPSLAISAIASATGSFNSVSTQLCCSGIQLNATASGSSCLWQSGPLGQSICDTCAPGPQPWPCHRCFLNAMNVTCVGVNYDLEVQVQVTSFEFASIKAWHYVRPTSSGVVGAYTFSHTAHVSGNIGLTLSGATGSASVSQPVSASPSRGIGSAFARVTELIGAKKCVGCGEREARLNDVTPAWLKRWMPAKR